MNAPRSSHLVLWLVSTTLACSSSAGSPDEAGGDAGGAGAATMGAAGNAGGPANGSGGKAGKAGSGSAPVGPGQGGGGTAGKGGSSGGGAAGSGATSAAGTTGASGKAGAGTAGTNGTSGTGGGSAGSMGTAGGPSGAGGSGTTGGAGGAPPGGGATSSGGGTSTSSARVVGYFAAWSVYARDYHVPMIPADKLTHVNYAFANLSDAGECVLGDAYADTDKAYPGDTWDPGVLRGSFHQLQLLKAAHPKLKTLISVGGWTWSAKFSDAALTEASRKKLATSCAAFADKYGFDGVDIDWEYPGGGGLAGNGARPEDKQNYNLLLGEFRAALGPSKLLTIAAPSGPEIIAHLDPAGIAAHVDWINVMTYDFNGPWATMTGFNAPLHASQPDPTTPGFNSDAAISAYLAAGVPPSKLNLGAPFYGRGFAGVSTANHGLFQPFTGPSAGTWEMGVLDYHDIAQNYLGTMTRYWDDVAKVPWLFDPAKGVLITYDDPESIAAKTAYVKSKGLGGVLFWELSGDDTNHTLLNAVNQGLQ